jgi:hypothetical protein
MLGAMAARIKHTLDGMCVNTMVLMRPIRFDNHAATGKEKADSTPLQKKNSPAAERDSSNLLNSHSATSDCTAKPPANESMLNRTAIL